jgi:hypothetical protein
MTPGCDAINKKRKRREIMVWKKQSRNTEDSPQVATGGPFRPFRSQDELPEALKGALSA